MTTRVPRWMLRATAGAFASFAPSLASGLDISVPVNSTHAFEVEVGVGESLATVEYLLNASYAAPGNDTSVRIADQGLSICGGTSIERHFVPCAAGNCAKFIVRTSVPLWERGPTLGALRTTTSAGVRDIHLGLSMQGSNSRFRLESVATPPADFRPPGGGGFSPTQLPLVGNPERAGTLDIGQTWSPNRVARIGLNNVAMRTGDCTGICVDVDRDGLNDLWEFEVLEQLAPIYVFDESEPFFDNNHHLATLAAVIPLQGDFLVTAFVPTFTQDYGTEVAFGAHIGSHLGDTESIALVWKRDGADFRWVRTLHKAHFDFASDPTYKWSRRQAFFDAAVPQISIEEAKHGPWPSTKACQDGQDGIPASNYDCGEGRYLRPGVFNIGDAANAMIIDAFNSHLVLGSMFPGEAAFNDADRFCGGFPCVIGGFDFGSSAVPGSVIRNVLDELAKVGWLREQQTGTTSACAAQTATPVSDFASAAMLSVIL